MRLRPWAERLEQADNAIRRVRSAAELASALEKGFDGKFAVFIVPLKDPAEPNEVDAGAHQQVVSPSFGIVYAVRDHADQHGGRGLDQLEDLREPVRALLMGWTPDPDCIEPADFVGGNVYAFADGAVWYLDEFRTGTVYRQESFG